MSPAIRIDDEVYKELQARAQPFVDTPNSVLRRLLGLDFDEVRDPERDDVDDAAGDAPTGSASPRARPTQRRQTRVQPRGGRGRKRTRLPAGALLPEERYWLPLLATLEELGGSAPARKVIDAVGDKLDSDLTDLDRANLPSGNVRWHSRVQFTRLRLVERGLMAKQAPRGVWAISEAGRSWLASQRQTQGPTAGRGMDEQGGDA